MEVSISFVICIAIAILNWFVAGWFFEAAEAKGYHDKKYFWICFWLSCIGYLLIIALPDRGNSHHVVNDELPEL